MSVSQMRARLTKCYDNDKWAKKVARMTDRQVIAVYYSFLNRGEFTKQESKPDYGYHQMTLSEFGL